MPSGKKKTHEEFVDEVYDLVGNEYTLLGSYINTSTPILIRHNVCQHEYPIIPHDFLRNYNRCPQCYKNYLEQKKNEKLNKKLLNKNKTSKAKTQEQFTKEVFDLVEDEYSVLGKYKNTDAHIIIKHNKCGYEYPVTPSKFLQGNRCPHCSKSKKKITEQFKTEVYNLVGDEYSVESEYNGSNKHIEMIHKTCGYKYITRPDRFLQGGRCLNCNPIKIKKSNEEFLEEVYNLVKDEYTVLSEYEGANKYITMKHNKCQNIYPIKPSGFLSGNRCPLCNESKGERRIKQILNQYNIVYESEYTFSDLVGTGGGLLRFDVAVFNKNKLWFLIEYDGIFHYKKQYDEDGFQTLKIHDKLKDKYCKNNNIHLLRIPYLEFDNIEKIITNFVQELSEKDSSFLVIN